jgi:hypothetical protein
MHTSKCSLRRANQGAPPVLVAQGAGHEGERRLTLRGRSPTIRGPVSAGRAWRRRHSGDRFRPDIDRPAERRQPPCLGAETPAGSCWRSVRVHQPWLSAPRVSLAANLVAWHSTPNSTAPRSQTQRLLACCCARVGRSSCYCTVPAGTLRIACRPPTETIEHCADLQPPRPRPHGSAAACSRGTRKSAPSCAHNNPDFKVDLIHFRSRSSGLAGS